MKLTKQHRITFARTLRYYRRTISFPESWNANIPVPRADIRDRNIRCIVESLKKEGINKNDAKAYCELLDAAADRPWYYVQLTVGVNRECPSLLKSPALPLKIAALQFERIRDSLRSDNTTCVYHLELFQVRNPVAIEDEVL